MVNAIFGYSRINRHGSVAAVFSRRSAEASAAQPLLASWSPLLLQVQLGLYSPLKARRDSLFSPGASFRRRQCTCGDNSGFDRRLVGCTERSHFASIVTFRRYGPPKDWKGPPPQKGCEVFVGKLPRDVMEYELVPVFERIGKIYEMRMMMDFNGSNRGYAFVTYCDKHQAKRACQELNGFEIRRGRFIGVLKSVDNCRLYVSGIPRDKTRDDVKVEMSRLTEGVVDVILYPSAVDKSKNRGFAFVEYESHRCAAMARRKLAPNRLTLWGNEITVDWAEPERDVDEETMAQVKKLYIRNLMMHTTEEHLKQTVENISGPGTVERVKKIRDYAFVHFTRREDAIKVQDALNDTNLDGSVVEVKLAKPPDRSIMRFVKNAQKLGNAKTLPFPLYWDSDAPAAQLYSAALSVSGREPGSAGTLTEATSQPSALQSPEIDRTTTASAYMGFPCIDPFAIGPTFPSNPSVSRPGGGGTGRFVGRGAAGMRAASFQAMVNSTYRRSRYHYGDMLDEYCKQNNWGSPRYSLNSTSQDGPDSIKLYSYNVEIPSLTAACGLFQVDQMVPDKQEAREVAAQHVLGQLGVATADVNAIEEVTTNALTVVPVTNIRSPSGDSGISAGSNSSTKVATYEMQPHPSSVSLSSALYPGFNYRLAAGYENYLVPDVGTTVQPLLVHNVPFGTATSALPATAWMPSYVGVYNPIYAAEVPTCFAPTFSPCPTIYFNYDVCSNQPQSGCMSVG
ncbi:hypothetical protein M514_03318 [Trichuris suis]|uniref:RRM domain-containing protein n=1 Tax=Trichuris suis TaxID=68888 RepID=A0A085NL73_9BILA|nr:hypothetical protein M514_03318 [Trichuris suis]